MRFDIVLYLICVEANTKWFSRTLLSTIRDNQTLNHAWHFALEEPLQENCTQTLVQQKNYTSHCTSISDETGRNGKCTALFQDHGVYFF